MFLFLRPDFEALMTTWKNPPEHISSPLSDLVRLYIPASVSLRSECRHWGKERSMGCRVSSYSASLFVSCWPGWCEPPVNCDRASLWPSLCLHMSITATSVSFWIRIFIFQKSGPLSSLSLFLSLVFMLCSLPLCIWSFRLYVAVRFAFLLYKPLWRLCCVPQHLQNIFFHKFQQMYSYLQI